MAAKIEDLPMGVRDFAYVPSRGLLFLALG